MKINKKAAKHKFEINVLFECLEYIRNKNLVNKTDNLIKYIFYSPGVWIVASFSVWIFWMLWYISVLFPPLTIKVLPSIIKDHKLIYDHLFWSLYSKEKLLIYLNNINLFSFIVSTLILIIVSAITHHVISNWTNQLKIAVEVSGANYWKQIINRVEICHLILVSLSIIFYFFVIYFFCQIPYISEPLQSYTTENGVDNYQTTNGLLNFDLSKASNQWKVKKVAFGSVTYIFSAISLLQTAFIIPFITINIKTFFKNNKFFFSFDQTPITFSQKCELFFESINNIVNKKKNEYLENKVKKSLAAVNNKNFVIELKNVNHHYWTDNQKRPILKDINLQISRGEFVVILGISGSGKTTLLNIISGLEKAKNGEVVVADHNFMAMHKSEKTHFRRKYISYIFQNYSLFPNLTVKENILMGQYLYNDFEKKNKKIEYKNKKLNLNINKKVHLFFEYYCKNIFSFKEKQNFINQIIEVLALNEHSNKYPHQLSGGQQQRVSIGRSLAKKPLLLFADEPTGAIDGEMCQQILKIFYLINKIFKITIVLITHNPLIAQLGNRIIIVKNGQIIKNKINTNQKTVEQISWD